MNPSASSGVGGGGEHRNQATICRTQQEVLCANAQTKKCLPVYAGRWMETDNGAPSIKNRRNLLKAQLLREGATHKGVEASVVSWTIPNQPKGTSKHSLEISGKTLTTLSTAKFQKQILIRFVLETQ